MILREPTLVLPPAHEIIKILAQVNDEALYVREIYPFVAFKANIGVSALNLVLAFRTALLAVKHIHQHGSSPITDQEEHRIMRELFPLWIDALTPDHPEVRVRAKQLVQEALAEMTI